MKRYLTIINLFLTTAVVFFSVDTFYKMAVARLDMTPSEDRHERQNIKIKTEKVLPKTHYTAILDRNLFQIKKESTEAPKHKAPQKVAIDDLKVPVLFRVRPDDQRLISAGSLDVANELHEGALAHPVWIARMRHELIQRN